MRAGRSQGKMNGEPAQELIGGSINMQLILPKEDRAGTAENDLIAEAQ